MLKRGLLVLLVCVGVAGFALNGISANQEVTPSGYTIARVCIAPHKLYWPKGVPVYGLSLGIPATTGQGEGVYGLDLGLIFTKSQYVAGLQLSCVNTGTDNRGVQLAIANISKDIKGVQVGVFNNAAVQAGVQLGVVNYAKKSTSGIQLGLINVMKNGFLPVFPFFNFSVK